MQGIRVYRLTAPVSAMVATALLMCFLTACSGGKERQAKYFERAQQQYQQGNYEQARTAVKNALRIHNRHAGARYLLALLDEREKNWQQMLVNLESAVELDPAYMPARLKLGWFYYAGRFYDKALEQAEAILARQPDNPDARALRGGVFFRHNRFRQAIHEAELALKEQPANVAALSILREVYKAEESKRASAVVGDGGASASAAVQLSTIEALAEQQWAGDIEKAYQKLVEDYPENLFFHYLLVKFYQRHQRIGEAEALLQRLVKAKPGNVNLKLWLAQFLADHYSPEHAETALKEFLEKDPTLTELRVALGRIYLSKGRYDEAIAAFNNVIAIRPAIASGYINLAGLYVQQGDYQQAMATYQRGLEQNPDNVQLMLLLANVHQLRQDYQRAAELYESVLSQDPRHPLAINNLAMLYVEQLANETNRARALELVQILQASNRPEFLDTLGWVYHRTGNSAKAVAPLRSAVELSGGEPLYRYHLGAAYLGANQPELARQSLQLALREGPFAGRQEAEALYEFSRKDAKNAKEMKKDGRRYWKADH